MQLASILGVEKETGFTLNYDKYNWEQHPDHFILEDVADQVDFGEGKKSIYALDGTEILVQKDKEVQMAVNAFGSGRSVYISGLPYSFENSRVLYRAILWSAHSEEALHKWFSTNYNVEVHAFVANGKYCVVNNTYVPQDTTVYIHHRVAADDHGIRVLLCHRETLTDSQLLHQLRRGGSGNSTLVKIADADGEISGIQGEQFPSAGAAGS